MMDVIKKKKGDVVGVVGGMSTVQYSTVQYSAVQHSTVQFGRVE